MEKGECRAVIMMATGTGETLTTLELIDIVIREFMGG
jgi:type I site-specific restriction endonuclease